MVFWVDIIIDFFWLFLGYFIDFFLKRFFLVFDGDKYIIFFYWFVMFFLGRLGYIGEAGCFCGGREERSIIISNLCIIIARGFFEDLVLDALAVRRVTQRR